MRKNRRTKASQIPGTILSLEALEDRQLLASGILPPANIVLATNLSSATNCAEDDNANVVVQTPVGNRQVTAYTVTASHPSYDIGQDNGAPNFDNCQPAAAGYAFSNPGVTKLFDDGTTVVEAVRQAEFWRPTGMTATVGKASVNDAHFIRLYRKIAGVSEYPQIFVLYADGNGRLKPQPPLGRSDTFFGSSVIIGPASPGDRPFADVSAVTYDHATDNIEVTYRAGGSATLHIAEVNRQTISIDVRAEYATPINMAFATFRSMFVADGNADSDHAAWIDSTGKTHDDAILSFQGGEGTGYLFQRETRSVHNTSAPDVLIDHFRVIDSHSYSTPNEHFVAQVYLDILQREVEPAGLAAWSGALAGGLSRSQVAQGIWQSAEHRGREIDEYYVTFLKRDADSEGRAAWVKAFLNGSQEVDIVRAFLGSDEYRQNHNSDAAFVKAVYQDLLGRSADEAGQSAWQQVLQDGMSREELAANFLKSNERYNQIVDWLYANLLGRRSDPGAGNSWVAALKGNATLASAGVGFMGSDEYFALAQG